MVTAYQKAKILQLKGLGFEIKEIAEKLEIRPGQVMYWARKIERQARAEGEDAIFVRVMADGVIPELLGFMDMAKQFGK